MEKTLKPRLSIATLKELKGFAKEFTEKIRTLSRRNDMRGLRRLTPIIILDPDNPGEVKVCYELLVKKDDGSFIIICICNLGMDISYDVCTRTQV